MIRCVIIDDEPLAVNVLKDYLETHELKSLQNAMTDSVG